MDPWTIIGWTASIAFIVIGAIAVLVIVRSARRERQEPKDMHPILGVVTPPTKKDE